MLSEDDTEITTTDGLDISAEEEDIYDERDGLSLKDTTHIDIVETESKEKLEIHQQLDADEHTNILIDYTDLTPGRLDDVENEEDQKVTAEEGKNGSKSADSILSPVGNEDGVKTVDSGLVSKILDDVENEEDAEVVVEGEKESVETADSDLSSERLDEVDNEEDEDRSDVKSTDSHADASKTTLQRLFDEDIEISRQDSKAKGQNEEEETLSNDSQESEQPSSQRTETVTLLSFQPSEPSSTSGKVSLQESVEKDEEAFDRSAYYAIYGNITKRCQEERTKNTLLHREVSQYYRNKKMYHVFVQGKVLSDQKRYDNSLDEVGELSERNEKEQLRIRLELFRVKVLYLEKEREVNQLFKQFQDAELELGKKLENVVSGGSPNEIATERYLKRQKNRVTNLIKMRLNFIKLKNRCNEKTAALDALDNLGHDLHLIDYMQLKIDNKNLFDKVEEKDNELIKVRRRCENTMQVLAHVREKTESVNVEMRFLVDQLEKAQDDYVEVREELNGTKRERDSLRKLVHELKSGSSLVTKPKLLRDMANAVAEIDSISAVVGKCKEDCRYGALIVGRMRKVMKSPRMMSKLKAKLEGEAVTSVINSESTESTESSDLWFSFEDARVGVCRKTKLPSLKVVC